MTYNGDAENLLTVRLNRVYNATPEAIFAAFTNRNRSSSVGGQPAS